MKQLQKTSTNVNKQLTFSTYIKNMQTQQNQKGKTDTKINCVTVQSYGYMKKKLKKYGPYVKRIENARRPGVCFSEFCYK